MVIPEPTAACKSNSQLPSTQEKVIAASCKPKATYCRMKRQSLTTTVSASVNTLSKETLDRSDKHLQREQDYLGTAINQRML